MHNKVKETRGKDQKREQWKGEDIMQEEARNGEHVNVCEDHSLTISSIHSLPGLPECPPSLTSPICSAYPT